MEKSFKLLSDLVIHSKYARYIPAKKRRENWQELVERNMQMHIKKYPALEQDIKDAYEYVLAKEVLPSMRSLQFGGAAIEQNPARMYNCAFMPVDDIHAFSETMFLLLGGTGVGYSVQKRDICNIAVIHSPDKSNSFRYLVGDSIEGWADAIKCLFKCYTAGGGYPVFDYSDVREKGSRLVTSGGKAPGAAPLTVCIEKIRTLLESCSGAQMSDIDCHDAMCHLADAVLAGGIRRAAMISLFDKDSQEMIQSKSSSIPVVLEDKQPYKGKLTIGFEVRTMNKCRYYEREMTYDQYLYYRTNGVGWWEIEPQRGRANNSAMFLRKTTTKKEFVDFFKQVEASKAGEPGVYWTNSLNWGTNPCVEIGLRAFQFCNLVTINGSSIRNRKDFHDRCNAASFIATLQAGYTNFHYLRKIWRKTTEKDALLGVSITGTASNLITTQMLIEGADIVKETNKTIAPKISIRIAARTTCIKPEGTASLVLGTASGIHEWHSDLYARAIRIGKNEAVYGFLKTHLPDLIEDCVQNPETISVFSVPQTAPQNAMKRGDIGLLQQLERIAVFNEHWVKNGHSDGDNMHNVSATVYIAEDEWNSAVEWMWKNRNNYNGLSVLPFDGGTYKQTPFTTIFPGKYKSMMKTLEEAGEIDFDNVFESDDETNLSGEIACAGGACEI